MDDAANAADDERVPRRPHSRQLRTRAALASTRAYTSLAASRSVEVLDSSEPEMDEAFPAVLRRVRSFAADTASEPRGALREINNSSTRRTKRVLDESKIPPAEALLGSENSRPGVDFPASRSDIGARSLPRPPARRNRIFGLRATPHRRSDDSDSSRYIESLEAQLASLQTQLQSNTSPSLQRSNSSKLRALNAETKLLRQDISEWEKAFNERVREQTEQHDLVAGSLRARIRYLEKERDNKDQRIEELEAALDIKDKALDLLERAKASQDARLESMSSLVGTPRRRLDVSLDTSGPSRLPPIRSRTFIPVTPSSSRAPPRDQQQISSPLQSPRSRRQSEVSTSYDNAFDSGAESAKDSGYVTELTSETSDGMLLEGHAPSSGRPMSWAPTASPEMLQRSRPSQRRMRRFYTGNVAQSLILPAARSAGDGPLSAPITAPGTALTSPQLPTMSSPIRERFPVHSPSSSRGSISLDFRQRSATIDESVDPVKRSHGLHHDDVTPRPPGARHSRHATEGQITTPVRTPALDGFRFIRSDRESHGSDTTRPDTAAQQSDSVISDQSTLTGPGSTPSSPLRYTFGPELSIDEIVSPQRHQSRTPRRTSRNPSRVRQPAPRRATRLGQMIDHVHRSFEGHIVAARYLFASTWQELAVARPILEFRCWMVRVLLGRLRDKGTLFLVRRSAARASIANPAGLGLRVGVDSPVALGARREPRDEQIEEELWLDTLDDTDMILPPVAPPIHWLRFSMTLVCAVGVAIKDGPSTLFPTPGRNSRPAPLVHRREQSLLQYLLPGSTRRV